MLFILIYENRRAQRKLSMILRNSSSLPRALKSLFVIVGIIIGSWVSRIPDITTQLSLTVLTFSWILFARGISQAFFFPVTAWLLHKFGAVKTSFISGFVIIISLPLYSLTINWIGLLLLFVLIAGFFGSFDISINSLGAEYEKHFEQPIITSLHAWFNVGNFGAAFLGSLFIWLQTPVIIHYSIITSILLIVLYLTNKIISQSDLKVTNLEKKQFSLPKGSLILLGLILFIGAIIEGSVGNWIPLYYEADLTNNTTIISIGYTFYSGAMLIGRFLGDHIRKKIGLKLTLKMGLILGAVGLTICVLFANVWLVSAGFIIAGLGISVVFPLIFLIAGKINSMAIASVATMSYVGYIIAPILIGFISETSSIKHGFIAMSVCAFLMVLIAQFSTEINKE